MQSDIGPNVYRVPVTPIAILRSSSRTQNLGFVIHILVKVFQRAISRADDHMGFKSQEIQGLQ